MDPFDLSTTDLSQLSDDDLVALAADVAVEQHRRALEHADPDALVEQGFERGFTTAGAVIDPWLVDGLLVCPGVLVEKSKASHDCAFVSLKLAGADASQWVFEATDLVTDVVRFLPGAKKQQRSISIVAATEGLEVDVVVAQMRSGQHKMKQVRSFKVTRGELVHVSTRAQVRADGHR